MSTNLIVCVNFYDCRLCFDLQLNQTQVMGGSQKTAALNDQKWVVFAHPNEIAIFKKNKKGIDKQLAGSKTSHVQEPKGSHRSHA